MDQPCVKVLFGDWFQTSLPTNTCSELYKQQRLPEIEENRNNGYWKTNMCQHYARQFLRSKSFVTHYNALSLISLSPVIESKLKLKTLKAVFQVPSQPVTEPGFESMPSSTATIQKTFVSPGYSYPSPHYFKYVKIHSSLQTLFIYYVATDKLK